jgi:addiction module HigA family antidote
MCYTYAVIRSFGDGSTEDLWNGKRSARARRFAVMEQAAMRKLMLLNAATTLADLAGVPGNALEALKGSLKGWHSIRINRQWRVIFRWFNDGPHRVKITDYHLGDRRSMIPKHRIPPHPGEILLEEFLVPSRMTQAQLAGKMRVPLQRVNEVVNGKRGITAETALLLSTVWDVSPEMWLNLQATYDLAIARQKMKRAG